MIRFVWLILVSVLICGCQKEGSQEREHRSGMSYEFKDTELEEWKRIIYASKERYEFQSLKNPFLDPKMVAEIEKKQKIFNYELKGILTKNGKKYALFQDYLKRGYFVSEGTKFAGHHVKTIGNDYVIIETQESDLFGRKIKLEIKLSLKNE